MWSDDVKNAKGRFSISLVVRLCQEYVSKVLYSAFSYWEPWSRLWIRKSSNRVGRRGWIVMWVERASEAICSAGKFETRFVNVGRVFGEFLRKWRGFDSAILFVLGWMGILKRKERKYSVDVPKLLPDAVAYYHVLFFYLWLDQA